jgi:hypothetical protein
MASIHISRPGTFKSAEGADIEITPDILAEVAKTYDPAKFEAQLVIGHPRMDAPSFGGVRSLSFGSNGLEAEADPTDDARDLVAKRHFKSVSASFYTPTAPNNPTPGKWHLRHVGLLGATPPAVKGLRALSFSDAEEGVLTFGELPGHAGGMVAGMFRRIRDWLIAEKGQDVADRVLPDWEVESLRSVSQRAAEEPEDDEPQGGTPGLSFADPSKAATSFAAAARTAGSSADSQPSTQEKAPMKTVEQLQAELDASNAQLQTLQAAEKKREADVRHAEHLSFADGLVAAAKWPAGAKDVLVATLDHLAQPDGVVSFGEGDAAKPLHQALREHLQDMPESVSFAEIARKSAASGGALTDRQVADRAADYQKRLAAKGQNITISEAIDAVNSGADQA